jgi:ERF superfamily
VTANKSETVVGEVKSVVAQSNGAPDVFRAINEVMGELAKEGISKDQKNTMQNYKFRGIDDVYNALSSKMTAAGLIATPRVLSRERIRYETTKGGVLFSVTVDVLYTLYSMRDGSSVEALVHGEAMDSGDKATNKAMSAAYKYMAMQVFCIPTEGDNDADSATHEVARPSQPTQRAAPRSPPGHPNSYQRPEGQKSSAQAKKDGDWERLTGTLAAQRTREDLEAWAVYYAKPIDALPPKWKIELREKYRDALAAADDFAAAHTEDGGHDPETGELADDGWPGPDVPARSYASRRS